MISPRAIIRDRRIALPRIPATRLPALPRWWRSLPPLHLLWLAVWAPWWVGNELPPPPLPRSREADMADPPAGTPGAWLLDSLDDLKFRFGLAWTASLLLRGAWLGGVAGIGWLLLGMIGVAPSPSVRALAILAGAGAALGLALRLVHRPRYAQIALLLERAFDLRSRLSTAVTGLRYGAPEGGGLHALQLADAANALDRARWQLRPIHWVPIREIFFGFIVALTMLLLLVAQRPEGEIPAVSSAGVPQFVPVSERLAASRQEAVPPEMPDPATLQQVEDISRTSNQAREDLETIAGALQTNPKTAPAGDAISNEDYAGANQRLDDAAQDVTQLPQADREKLADELDRAADQVSDQNPELADSARKAADDVRNGEDTGALGDLGDEIEQTGQDVIPQQSSGGALSESSADQESAPQSGSSWGGESAADQESAPQSGSSGGGESAQAEQPQSGQQGSGQTQAASEGDPGSGMNASAGTGESQDGGTTSQGDGGGQSDQQPSNAGDGQGQQSADAQSDGSSGTQGGQQGGENQASSGGSTSGSPNEEGDSAQGSGAGGGERNANDPTNENAPGGGGGDLNNEEQAPEAGRGEAGDPPPGGNDQGGDDQQAGAAGGGASIQLPGTSDERVRSGSDIGASSVGTGGGVGAASGDSSGSASGSTGPDPNTVPAEWRSVVEDYFRQGGTP